MRGPKLKQGILAVCLALLSFVGTFSQEPPDFGSFVTGVVSDQTGAIIPNAEVSFEGINGKKLTTTNMFGRYWAQLPRGEYKMTVSARGYCDISRPTFELGQLETLTFNVTLFSRIIRTLVEIDPVTKKRIERSIARNPFEEIVFKICNRDRPGSVTIRYGKMVMENQTYVFSGFSTSIRGILDGNTFEREDLMPVSVFFGNEELRSDEVRFDKKKEILLMRNVRWTHVREGQAMEI